jgi:pyridoxamine 5'-phosphate oxidase
MSDPLGRLAEWIDEARRRGAPEPEAMALATATAHGVPSVRVVLCRGIDSRGIRFFTNYESRKGLELEQNPRAAACFFWAILDAQVRVEGPVERLPASESDDYFGHRPRGHRLSALASPQSRPIESMETLRTGSRQIATDYEGRDVPRPLWWGGYKLTASSVEIWTRGADRLHERIRFERRDSGPDAAWASVRLAP